MKPKSFIFSGLKLHNLQLKLIKVDDLYSQTPFYNFWQQISVEINSLWLCKNWTVVKYLLQL